VVSLTVFFHGDSRRHNDVTINCITVSVNLVYVKFMRFSDEDKILIKNCHNSAWNSL